MARTLEVVNEELADARYLLSLAYEQSDDVEIFRLTSKVAVLETEQFDIEFSALFGNK